MNQSAIRVYQPSALGESDTAVGTDQASSNAGGTACPEWPLSMQAATHSTSDPLSGTDRALAVMG
jgi:hypothetical protein